MALRYLVVALSLLLVIRAYRGVCAVWMETLARTQRVARDGARSLEHHGQPSGEWDADDRDVTLQSVEK